ncbi:MAG: hypothetical protein WBQ39_18140, partial [Terriglobales bacterium]
MGLASALAELSLAVLASLAPAITGTAVTAIIKRIDNHVFNFNIERCLLSVVHRSSAWGAILCVFLQLRHDAN